MLYKSPLTLISLSARKLFERQYDSFERLPLYTRKVVTQKLAVTFLKEGEEAFGVFEKLKGEIETLLRRRDPKVKQMLEHILHAWICDTRRANIALKRTLELLSREIDWESADVSTLVFYTEVSRGIGENIVAFVEEARCSSIRGFLFAKFKFYHPTRLHREERYE